MSTNNDDLVEHYKACETLSITVCFAPKAPFVAEHLALPLPPPRYSGENDLHLVDLPLSIPKTIDYKRNSQLHCLTPRNNGNMEYETESIQPRL